MRSSTWPSSPRPRPPPHDRGCRGGPRGRPAADDSLVNDAERAAALALRLTGADLSPYKDALVTRRLRARARTLGLTNASALLDRLETEDPAARAEVEALVRSLSVQVSAFFRDAAVFRQLEEVVVPALLGEGRALRLWSAACAQGQEAYSLAALFRRARPSRPFSVLGTDVDDRALAAARAAEYPARALKGLPPEIVDEAFVPAAAGRWAVREELRRQARFERGDLLDLSGYPSELDLIACRNILIYLHRDVQERVLIALAGALRPGGYLLLGQGETVIGRPWRLFEHVSPSHRIYRKPV